MVSHKSISDDEHLARRITNRPDNLKDRPGIGLTATSFAIRPRAPELHPSWSRASVTSPAALLDIERAKGRDVSGWSVVALKVADVRALGLDVVCDPTDEDPGHCLIVPTADRSFSDTIWSKLAKKTRIVLTLPEIDR